MSDESLKLHVGEKVTQFFLIRTIEKRLKKTDSLPYLVLELCYEHGRIWGHIWDNVEQFEEEYVEGDIVKVQGYVELYNEQTQVNIKRIRKSVPSDDIYPEDLQPHSGFGEKQLKKKLQKSVKAIDCKHLRGLCSDILIDSPLGEIFLKAPGGKLWHHGYIGGLAEHTLSVTDTACLIAQNYNDVNVDIIRAGALLHDVGKAESYSTEPFIDYTDEGRLEGHIAIGYSIVKEQIGRMKDFPSETAKLLLHLILSHQGALEKASPVVPMIREAIILHYADEIDSQLNAFDRIMAEQNTPEKRWSSYVNLADRFFYFGNKPSV